MRNHLGNMFGAYNRRLVALGALMAALLSPVMARAQEREEAVIEAVSDPIAIAMEQAMLAAEGVTFVWVLVAAVLVFFMQAGFALVEAGFARARNTVNILTKNFMDFCIAGLAFWAFGFAIMFGGSQLFPGLENGNNFFGLSGFFLAGDAGDSGTQLFWIFQMVFAATAATIVSGAMSERTKINAYLAYSFLITALVYPVFGHWVWGNGWLGNLGLGAGVADFAGSGVVHAVGGISALIGAALVGPRLGKYGAKGEVRRMPGHNLPFIALGTLVLFVGWFGFNAGSTVSGTDTRIANIAVATMLAGVAGATVAFYWGFSRTGKPDITMATNGALAGLVGVTGPCAFIAPWAAVVIGAIAAGIMLFSLGFVENRLKIDDPVGAFSVHGAAGIWGLIAVGIFADGSYGVTGALYGDGGQLIAQLVGAGALIAWVAVASGAMFFLIKNSIGLRVPEADEIAGLDISEHGQDAYAPDDDRGGFSFPGRPSMGDTSPGLAAGD